MKLILIFISFLFCNYSNSQDLVGAWKGSFTDYSGNVTIGLRIELNSDSTLNIHSYTLANNLYGYDSIIICKVNVLKNKKGVLNLEEIDTTHSSPIGLQKMYLKYKLKDGKQMLEGIWKPAESKSMGHGYISFAKLPD